jgi:hypothetical protein
MIPGTQPRTDKDHDCAIIARQTWSPQSNAFSFSQQSSRFTVVIAHSPHTSAMTWYEAGSHGHGLEVVRLAMGAGAEAWRQ